MASRVAVTGIGLVTPAGATLQQVWDHVLQSASAAAPICRFDASSYVAQRAGVVSDDVLEDIPQRSLKRMDRFGALALGAARRAIDDSRLDLDGTDRSRVGVFMGNMYGGWTITEPSLRAVLEHRGRDVSPYVASASFPAAAQGHISIHWGLKGYSKTFAADTASSALALGYAADAISDGRAEVILAGGACAPITPYAYAFCDRSGRLDPTRYRPFDRRAAGFQVGEGATVLVLEAEHHARRRGARVHGWLAGWATRFAAPNGSCWSHSASALADVIQHALRSARRAPREIDYVALDAQGDPQADAAESAALRRVFVPGTVAPVCTSAKPALTHLLGGAAASEAAVALLAAAHGHAPPVAGVDAVDPVHGLTVATHAPVPIECRTALLNARGADGVHAAIVLTTEASG